MRVKRLALAACVAIFIYLMIYPPIRRAPLRNWISSTENEVIRFKDYILNFRILHFPEWLTSSCQEGNINLLVIVQSPPEDAEIRQIIRETWADAQTVSALQSGSAHVLFLVGDDGVKYESLEIEMLANEDIILTDVEDNYKNLVFKTAISLFISHYFCPTPFLLKADQDVVFNIDRFVGQIGYAFWAYSAAIYCKVWHSALPSRNASDKWYISESQFRGKIFPNYCNGPSYALTSFAVSKLLDALPSFNLITIEDVFITGIVAQSAGVTRIAKNGVFLSHYWLPNASSAACPGRILSVHNAKTEEEIRNMWTFLSKNC